MYKLSADLRFVATPGDTIAIIAALEARPEIESVSRVRMAKQGGSKVAADLTIEAWLVKSDAAGVRGRL